MMLENLIAIHNTLQQLEIRPIPNNVKILSGVYIVLEEMINELKDSKTTCQETQSVVK